MYMYFVIIICSVVLMLLLLKIYIKSTTGWCHSQVCLKGKTVLVTGANCGIGFETAIDLAKRDARVILACRNEEAAKEAVDKIVKETRNDNIVYKLDIISNEKHIDILINNAGAGGLGNTVSEDGLLATMQVNYFAPFLLTNLLLDILKKSPSGRIVNVASMVAKNAKIDIQKLNEFKGDMEQYGRSKLCNILFTIELASRLKDSNITTYSLHPGVVRTELCRRMPYLMRKITNFVIETFFKTAPEGAQTSIYLAVANDIEKFNGQHFHDCHLVERYPSCNDTLAKDLWIKTEKILKQY
ncbi:hypothetical protein NQ318_001987 [Aromia moschata]|uniref:Uncharacterized protein n=1 Tax=Aromia moschata TaxID=1265417 RepID=A0AAV8Z1E7_9CUCU|nr:hypothetical protein NQ318_001987 [Aromia moschata]